MVSDPLVVVAALADAFDGLGIPYLVGGSLASSLYGVPRATQDADLMADVKRQHIEPLTRALEPDFYVAAELISDAIRRRSSFNVIHLASMFKADIFLPRNDEWSREEWARVRTESISIGTDPKAIRFSSAEDTILHKVLWYRLGGDISDKQWSDILGILRIQATSLDWAYLEKYAAVLNVGDLLQTARKPSP
jgi:hypothetical protein